MSEDETVMLTQQEFDDLPEYSMSLPTGTTIGKQWKMGWGRPDGPLTWYLCEYVEIDEPGYVGIQRKEICGLICPESSKS